MRFKVQSSLTRDFISIALYRSIRYTVLPRLVCDGSIHFVHDFIFELLHSKIVDRSECRRSIEMNSARLDIRSSGATTHGCLCWRLIASVANIDLRSARIFPHILWRHVVRSFVRCFGRQRVTHITPDAMRWRELCAHRSFPLRNQNVWRWRARRRNMM